MDIRTLLICHLALLALHTAVLLVIRLTNRDLVGIGWLAYAYALVMVGTGLGAGRNQIPDVWSIVVGNALILFGYLLLHRAVSLFLDVGWRHRSLSVAIFAGFLVSAIYFTYASPNSELRIAAVSTAFAAQVGLTAFLLLRIEREGSTRAPERFLGLVLVVLAGLNALRAGLTVTRGAPENLLQGDAVQAASLLAFILASTSIVFGFIWMVGARRQVALHREADLDPLTGLLNRRGFLRVAPDRLRAMEEGQHMLLLFADLDGLKQVNDNLGHDVGDRVICETADALRDVLRASDSIARLGGDEFCALVPVKDPEDGTFILRRLDDRMHALGSNFDISSVGISAGAVPIDPSEGKSLEDLLRDGDRSMYLRKQARRRNGQDAER